ncbi:hypothetical protein LSAT2_024236, partial [Lamellibrachia satsuma]
AGYFGSLLLLSPPPYSNAFTLARSASCDTPELLRDGLALSDCSFGSAGRGGGGKKRSPQIAGRSQANAASDAATSDRHSAGAAAVAMPSRRPVPAPTFPVVCCSSRAPVT